MELQRSESVSYHEDGMMADYESSVVKEKRDSDHPISIKDAAAMTDLPQITTGSQHSINRTSSLTLPYPLCQNNTIINSTISFDQTDKSGHLLLETAADLENLLLLRKNKKEQRAAVRKPTAPPAVHMVPYYVDEEDFFKACDQNQLMVIDRYLSTGGDVNARDSFERTGLHRACSKGHIEVIAKLMEAGANIHLRDKLWSTCLHCACRGGNLSVLRLLLDHGADSGMKDKINSTPLHVAVRVGHQDLVEHLIQCGAEINTQDREGDSPLHDAVRLNRFKMIQLLMNHGADAHLTNQDGCRPLDGVMAWQNEMKSLLLEQKNK